MPSLVTELQALHLKKLSRRREILNYFLEGEEGRKLLETFYKSHCNS